MLSSHPGKLILLADHEDASRKAVGQLLGTQGYECHSSADGQEAIALLSAMRYDLLIAEPDIPGNEDLRLVRECREIAPGMPVILVSRCPSAVSAVEALQLPVVACFSKPVDLDLLSRQVQLSLHRSRVYGTVSRVLRHLADCIHDLNEVQQGHLSSREAPRSATVAVPTITLRMLASCLSELLALEGGLSTDASCGNLCQLLDCPQRPVLRDAMSDAVAVLERTKGTFKSKELGQLRIRLEHLLRK